jgi:hypothetical protein
MAGAKNLGKAYYQFLKRLQGLFTSPQATIWFPLENPAYRGALLLAHFSATPRLPDTIQLPQAQIVPNPQKIIAGIHGWRWLLDHAPVKNILLGFQNILAEVTCLSVSSEIIIWEKQVSDYS